MSNLLQVLITAHRHRRLLDNAAMRRALRALGCPLLVVALAGCASIDGIATKSTLRETSTIAAAASITNTAALSAPWPKEDWWHRYGDSQLDQLIDGAFRDSPSLHIAAARIRQATAVAGMAGAAAGPQVGASLKDTRQRFSEHGMVPKPLAGSWAWNNEASVGVRYDLDFWGKNQAAIEAAVGRVKASEADAYAARLMLAVGITHSYLQLAQAFDQLDLAHKLLNAREQILAITRQRVVAQIDSRMELKQAELAIPLAREQIAVINEHIALLRDQLAALVGQGPDRGLQIKRPRLAVVAPEGVPATLSADLIGRRPDLVAQRWRVQALSQDITGAKGRFYPDINLTALIGLQSLGFDRFLDAGSRFAGAGPAISLPIFDSGRVRSNLAAKSAAYDIAVEQYNQTLIGAVRDVVIQLTSMRWLREQMQQQAAALDAAQQAYALSLQRYRSGLGNYLQVLVAEGQVFSQQRAHIALNSRAYDLDVNLVRALGGGYWQANSFDRNSIQSAKTASTENE